MTDAVLLEEVSEAVKKSDEDVVDFADGAPDETSSPVPGPTATLDTSITNTTLTDTNLLHQV